MDSESTTPEPTVGIGPCTSGEREQGFVAYLVIVGQPRALLSAEHAMRIGAGLVDIAIATEPNVAAQVLEEVVSPDGPQSSGTIATTSGLAVKR